MRMVMTALALLLVVGPATGQTLGQAAAAEQRRLSALEEQRCPAVASDPAPCLISMPALQYPREARTIGLEGRVELTAFVDRSGRVTEARVEGNPPALLADAARSHVLARQYRPATDHGQPISTRLPIQINFALK